MDDTTQLERTRRSLVSDRHSIQGRIDREQFQLDKVNREIIVIDGKIAAAKRAAPPSEPTSQTSAVEATT